MFQLATTSCFYLQKRVFIYRIKRTNIYRIILSNIYGKYLSNIFSHQIFSVEIIVKVSPVDNSVALIFVFILAVKCFLHAE